MFSSLPATVSGMRPFLDFNERPYVAVANRMSVPSHLKATLLGQETQTPLVKTFTLQPQKPLLRTGTRCSHYNLKRIETIFRFAFTPQLEWLVTSCGYFEAAQLK